MFSPHIAGTGRPERLFYMCYLMLTQQPTEVTLLGFVDLSAAFDTVDHHILIKRMHHTFGISDCALRWITWYMDKRTQFVRFGGTVSATTMVMASVSQRSVLVLLGPAFFICYTSEIIKIIVDAGFNVQACARR